MLLHLVPGELASCVLLLRRPGHLIVVQSRLSSMDRRAPVLIIAWCVLLPPVRGTHCGPDAFEQTWTGQEFKLDGCNSVRLIDFKLSDAHAAALTVAFSAPQGHGILHTRSDETYYL